VKQLFNSATSPTKFIFIRFTFSTFPPLTDIKYNRKAINSFSFLSAKLFQAITAYSHPTVGPPKSVSGLPNYNQIRTNFKIFQNAADQPEPRGPIPLRSTGCPPSRVPHHWKIRLFDTPQPGRGGSGSQSQQER